MFGDAPGNGIGSLAYLWAPAPGVPSGELTPSHAGRLATGQLCFLFRGCWEGRAQAAHGTKLCFLLFTNAVRYFHHF